MNHQKVYDPDKKEWVPPLCYGKCCKTKPQENK